MYYLLSIIIGVVIASLVFFNGQLNVHYGLYIATVIIHVVGLVTITIVMLVRKKKFTIPKHLPWIVYTGGILGVATTLFNNIAFGKISVSAILALSLLGQSVTSIIIDQFGLFHSNKIQLRPVKFIGIAVVMVGIVIMIVPMNAIAVIPIIVSLATGYTCVVSRTTNAELAQASSLEQSTFLNYVLGLICSILVLVISGHVGDLGQVTISANLPIYLGGMLGALAIFLQNATVKGISSFYMTLFLFVGQTTTGILLDSFLEGAVSWKLVSGAVCVAVGLVFNLYMDQRQGVRTIKKSIK